MPSGCKRRGFTLIEITVALAIAGVLAALASASFSGFKCKAAQSEAKLALQAVQTLETDYFARNGRYADVMASCAAGADPAVHCIDFLSKGNQSFTVTGTGDESTFTVTAIGIAGSRAAGSVWRVDQTGAMTDVARTCGSSP